MKLSHVGAVLLARNREFVRDRASLGWNLLFPVLMVFGFALLFSGDDIDLYKVGVYGDGAASGFLDTDYIDFIAVDELEDAIVKVERHRLDLLIDRAGGRYWVNDGSPSGYMLERVLAGSGDVLERQQVSGREVRYVDWVVPGVLATNLMFSALFGVGYVIVRYRRAGVLRRLKATPLRPLEFLSAQVLSRLWLNVVIGIAVYIGTDYVIGFTMRGSYWTLLLVFVLGAASLISLGLAMAARTANQELAGGLLNVISWPMMLLSGAWFSLEGAPQWIQQAAYALPLTHLIDGARAVMIDGAGIAAIGDHLAALALMSAAFLLFGAALFRWE